MDVTTPLLIGVSGGVDSLCLLDGLNRLGYPLIVAHLDHALRPESADDARFVEAEAVSRELLFICERISVTEYAHQHHLSIEEAARVCRYLFLFDLAKKHSASSVVVAHNANDQVETVLMHLLRGSGLDGLTGMTACALPNPWSDTIPLLRPLLGVWRDEIEAYAHAHHLRPVFDNTNVDTTFFRNRLRHELVPELETYVPGFQKRLWQTADLLTADREILDDLVEKSWEKTVTEIDQDFVSFNLPIFDIQPLALKRRLIRTAVTMLRPGGRDLDFALVQRVLDFVSQPTSTGQADIGLNLRVSMESDRLVISEWLSERKSDHWPQLMQNTSLSIPGELNLGHDWVLRAEYDTTDIELIHQNEDPYHAWIDLGERKPSLEVRSRRPGDRIQLLGMDGKSIKLSDVMINVKLPQPARDYWPIVCLGEEIVWLPGYRLAEPFRITPETRVCISLKLSRN